MTRSGVRLTVAEHVAEVVLDAADRSNAIDLKLGADLLDAVNKVRSTDGLRAVLLRAEGRNFCVGGDLRDFAAHADDMGEHLRVLAGTVNAAVQILVQMPVPVVTAVHGAVAGAGLGLALSGDLCLAASSSRFRAAYIAVGLSPDAGVSALLPRAIGDRRAMEMLLTNRQVDAREALGWGLVAEVVADEELVTRARLLATQLAQLSKEAVHATKRLVHAGPERELRKQLAAEVDAISQLGGSDHTRRAIGTFLKR